MANAAHFVVFAIDTQLTASNNDKRCGVRRYTDLQRAYIHLGSESLELIQRSTAGTAVKGIQSQPTQKSRAATNAPARVRDRNEPIYHDAGEGVYGALRESEERYRALYTKTPVMLHSSDANRRLLSVSDHWLKTLGYERSEVIGERTTKFLTESSRQYAEQTCFPKFFRTGVLVDEPIQFRKKNGEIVDVLLSAVAERDADNNIIRSVTVSVDVTERKRAEEALSRLQRRNELILQAAGEGVYGLDDEGKTTFVNPAAAEMLGWDAEELIGQSMHAVHHHSKPDGSPYPAKECPIYAAFKDGSVHRVDNEVFWRKDGSSFPVEYTSTPIFEAGKRVGAVVVFWDITKRKQAEEALHSALAEIKQLKERLQAENLYLQEEIKTQHNFEEIVGNSDAMQRVLRKVEQVGSTDAAVLIHGETGTGKELIARAIHGLSPRKDRPLVKVNCGAISAGLVESELFGHEKGAFTGALQQRIGRFELANGGTIFLDEVGELPLDTQVKLLRVLQEQEFERVGSSRPIRVDVRVIAATNRDLAEEVKAGRFRMDLYYRLNVFPLEVPALRERVSDIPPLVSHLVSKSARKLGRAFDGVSAQTMDRLMLYPWPGNVRELENVIERAAIVARGPVIAIDESLTLDASGPAEPLAMGTLEEVERTHILSTLEKTNWSISGRRGAAAVLGLNPSTLRSRMQKLGIRKPKPVI